MKTRKEYDDAFRVVRAAVASWNPLGTLDGGAPEDEWDLEIARLLPRIQRAITSADVAREIAVAFGESIGGVPIAPKEINDVATAIFLRLKTADLLQSS
jgi:hypothetical protein